MTPEDRALRDLWLSELWPTVREHHQTRDEKAAAEARNAAYAQRYAHHGDDTPEGPESHVA